MLAGDGAASAVSVCDVSRFLGPQFSAATHVPRLRWRMLFATPLPRYTATAGGAPAPIAFAVSYSISRVPSPPGCPPLGPTPFGTGTSLPS